MRGKTLARWISSKSSSYFLLGIGSGMQTTNYEKRHLNLVECFLQSEEYEKLEDDHLFRQKIYRFRSAQNNLFCSSFGPQTVSFSESILKI